MKNVGVIGVGDFGSFVLGVFDLLEDFKLYAVSEIVPVQLKQGVKFYRDYHELLLDERVDVVYIATENYSHTPIAIQALSLGKEVLCEKPIYINESQKKDFQQAVEKSNKPIKINFVLPNSLIYQEVISAVKSLRYGKLLSISVENFASEIQASKRWYFDDSKTGGWFATSDIHFFHLLTLFDLGRPEILDVIKHQEADKVTSTFCYINLDSIPVTFYHFLAAEGRERFRATFVFEKAEMIVDGWVPMKLEIRRSQTAQVVQEKRSEAEVYLDMIAQNFRELQKPREELQADLARALLSNDLTLEANDPIKRYRII